MKINITEEVYSTTELVTLLEHITKQIDEGYTNGYYPHWNIEKTEEELLSDTK